MPLTRSKKINSSTHFVPHKHSIRFDESEKSGAKDKTRPVESVGSNAQVQKCHIRSQNVRNHVRV